MFQAQGHLTGGCVFFSGLNPAVAGEGWAGEHGCVCVCMYLRVFICVCLCECMHYALCMCVCLHVCECVCVPLGMLD